MGKEGEEGKKKKKKQGVKEEEEKKKKKQELVVVEEEEEEKKKKKQKKKKKKRKKKKIKACALDMNPLQSLRSQKKGFKDVKRDLQCKMLQGHNDTCCLLFIYLLAVSSNYLSTSISCSLLICWPL